MRQVFRRRAPLRVLILIAILVLLPSITFAFPGNGPGCVFTCRKTVDITECKQATGPTFGAAKTCEVVSSCYVWAMDPDGPGGAPPILMTTCSYDCAMEYCVWV